MIHLTKKWVRQNLVKTDTHPLFVKREFGYNKKDLVAGMITCDGSFDVPFTTKDGRHWLMFSIRRINKEDWTEFWNKGYRYIMILHDADDLFIYMPFVSRIAAQEWLYTYFNFNINLAHIESCYHYF